MVENQTGPFTENAISDEDTISILDILLVIGRYRKLIARVAAVVVIPGLAIAIFSPNEYTSSAKVIRETETESIGGISGGLEALRGFGINLGRGSVGLTADTYPDILLSREVRLGVVRTSFYFADKDTTMRLADYYSKFPGLLVVIADGLKKATIGLPGTILRLFRKPPPRPVIVNGEPVYPTEDEEKAIERLEEQITVSVDRNSGIMRIAFTSHNPLLSVQVTSTLIHHLTQRVRTIYSRKERETLDFIRDRFMEVQHDLNIAEEELARFTDSNINPQTARLKTELARLERKVNFKSQLYTDLQTQLTQAEIKLQRSEPVITLVEAPVPPIEKSGPNRKLLVLGSLLLGLFIGLGLAYLRHFIDNLRKDQREANRLDEVQRMFSALIPAKLKTLKEKRSKGT